MIRVLKFICIIGLFICTISCDTYNKKQQSLTAYIPENSKTIIKIANLQDDLANIASNDLLFPILTKPKLNDLLQNLNASTTGLLCVGDTINKEDYTFITRYNSNVFKSDSIKINFDKITPITLNKNPFFALIKDSVLVISSYKKQIEQVKNNQVLKDAHFEKAYKIANNQGLSFLVKKPKVVKLDSVISPVADWICLNTTISSSSIQAQGVALYDEKSSKLFSVFKGLTPQTNKFYDITPPDVTQGVSFTYNDLEKLQKNLKRLKKDTVPKNSQIFNLINEVASLKFASSDAVVLKSLDIEATKESVLPYLKEFTTYKGVKIYKFLKPDLVKETFFPLIKTENLSLALQLEEFLVLVSNQALAEHFINTYNSKNTFANTSFFRAVSQDVSQTASLVFIENSKNIFAHVSEIFKITPKSQQNTNQFPYAIIQARTDQGFTHINIITQAISNKDKSNTKNVSEIASVTLDTTIVAPPIFFTNHITKEKEIVVQDVLNNLYLISATGKIIWKKPLDSKILGKIQEIDLLKNNKKQLAFTTKTALYVIDRNGNAVSPFPLKFKEKITQPLAVFDYDNKRDYRFAVVMDKAIKLYNNKGKQVRGFTFSKTDSPIILSPTHIKVKGKDYILLATQNGKLHILSRTGKTRIRVNKKFDFSETSIVKEGYNFVVITKDNIKHSIDIKGNVKSLRLKVTGPYYFAINGNTKATLDDNLLRINGKLIELPYGIYNKPEIYKIKNQVFVLVLDTQENKLFVFNRNGKLLTNFPVFGMRGAAIAYSKGKYLLVTQRDAKTVMLYAIQP